MRVPAALLFLPKDGLPVDGWMNDKLHFLDMRSLSFSALLSRFIVISGLFGWFNVVVSVYVTVLT